MSDLCIKFFKNKINFELYDLQLVARSMPLESPMIKNKSKSKINLKLAWKISVLKNINPRKTYIFRMTAADSFLTVTLLNIEVASHKYKRPEKKCSFMHLCDERDIYLRVIFKN